MSLEIRLVGAPQVTIDGHPRPAPRGRKVWGLLAYLLLTEREASRSWLAGLLFSDADDPLGALRWSLAELRRLVGPDASVSGDPVVLALPPDAVVDVLAPVSPQDGARPPIDLGRELLEGIDFATAPGFDGWLTSRRRQLVADATAEARQAVMAALAARDLRSAMPLAASMVELDPLDESAQALFVRCLVGAGDRTGATRQFNAARDLLKQELGVEAGPDLRAAGAAIAEPRVPPTGSRPGQLAAARAQFLAGRAAIAAGALDAGIANLQAAAAGAIDGGDRSLEGSVLAELGAALVHSVRGRDDEGATVLHRALKIGEETGEEGLTARACGELGWVDLLAGRHATALSWFERASTLLQDDPGARSWTEANRGIVLCDVGRHSAGLAILETAAGLAEESGHDRNLAWSLAFIGRSHLLRGELDLARPALEGAHRLAQEVWPFFIPWPESLLGDAEMAASRPDRALQLYEDAFAHACQLADPCWEGMSLRGLGFHAVTEGRRDDGVDQLLEACARAVRFDDTYQWAVAYCRDGLVQGASVARSGGAAAWADELKVIALRLGMQEFAARAHLYLAELGRSDGALEAARALAAEVENPALEALIRSHESSHARP